MGTPFIDSDARIRKALVLHLLLKSNQKELGLMQLCFFSLVPGDVGVYPKRFQSMEVNL